jgi:hypothetical protein
MVVNSRVSMVTDQNGEQVVPGLRVIASTKGWAFGEVGGCLAIVWRDQPTAEAFRRRNEELLALCGRTPGHCALVEVIEPSSKPPPSDVRRVAMEVFKQLGGNLSAVGFVLEGTEMRSAFARALLTGMMFLTKQLQPWKVFKNPSSMAEWIRPRVGAKDPQFEPNLVFALEHLRGLIASR